MLQFYILNKTKKITYRKRMKQQNIHKAYLKNHRTKQLLTITGFELKESGMPYKLSRPICSVIFSCNAW